MAEEVEEKGWTFDAFDSGTQQLAGKKELQNYQTFISEYADQLRGIEDALDESLGDAWDFNLDPIALQTYHSEHATLLELIKTNHKILNKVVTVFSVLCAEIEEHCTKAKTKFYIPLMMYGEGGDLEKGLQEGEAQLMMGRMLPVLQDLVLFVNRINELVKNVLEQLASLYSQEGMMHVMNHKDIHLQTVFEHIGDALAILITLDHIFMHTPILKEHWSRYKRIITSIRSSPMEYGVDETKLKPFEKLLQTLEGKLMEGQIFKSCVTQIFDSKEVLVTQNAKLMEEFSLCLRSTFGFLDSRIGEMNEMGQRQKLIGFCGLLVLHHQFTNDLDRTLVRQVWDVHKKIPAVHIIGHLTWFHTDFLLRYLPTIPKKLDKKQLHLPKQLREQFLVEKSQNLTRISQQYYMQVSAWMIRMETDLTTTSPRARLTLDIIKREITNRAAMFIQGMLLAYSIGNLVRTTLGLHQHMDKPMNKSGVLAICRLAELLKCIQYTFHRRSLIVAEYLVLIINHYELGLLKELDINWTRHQETKQKGYSDRLLDVIAAVDLMKSVLNGPGTKERRLVAHIAYHFTLPRSSRDDDRTPALLRKLDAICELHNRVQEMCDCSFFYWQKEVVVPLYLADIYQHPTEAHRLHYMFAALRDCIPAMRLCKHQAEAGDLMGMFEKEVDFYMKEKVLQPLRLAIEEDLRLSTHLHLKLDDRNPFKVGLHDLKHFMDVKPIRFFDRSIDIRAHVTHYLDTTFYNLTTVALHDWKSYGDMRNLARKKYGLDMLEPHLPSATLEQGLDVLEIMRHIHIFVTRYCYNLNNQIFVERQSNNKHLNTINIRHIANSIRTHGTGIMNTTVNFTYQFLRKKFFIFSQFMYDEYIKARLLKEIRFYKEEKIKLEQRYPFSRAERFNKVIRKLGSSPDGLSYLDQFRVIITQIGNAMGYIRMIRSGGLHCCSNAIRFVPDLEDIVQFEELVAGPPDRPPDQPSQLPDEAMAAARLLDSVVGNLAKNFAEGTEYFKLLVDVFASVFRNPKNRHLQNFYMIVPPLTMNYVEYMMTAKDKMNKKNKVGATFTDDGFAMGVAYILKLVDQYHAFDSLHWFDAVKAKYEQDKKNVRESSERGREDTKLQATISLSIKRIENYTREFDLLHYSLSSARIFFRADLTAEEEEERKKDDDVAAGGEGGAPGEAPPPANQEGGGGGGPPPPPTPVAGGGPPPPPPPPPPPLPPM